MFTFVSYGQYVFTLAYCFVRIAICIVSFFFQYRPSPSRPRHFPVIYVDLWFLFSNILYVHGLNNLSKCYYIMLESIIYDIQLKLETSKSQGLANVTRGIRKSNIICRKKRGTCKRSHYNILNYVYCFLNWLNFILGAFIGSWLARFMDLPVWQLRSWSNKCTQNEIQSLYLHSLTKKCAIFKFNFTLKVLVLSE